MKKTNDLYNLPKIIQVWYINFRLHLMLTIHAMPCQAFVIFIFSSQVSLNKKYKPEIRY